MFYILINFKRVLLSFASSSIRESNGQFVSNNLLEDQLNMFFQGSASSASQIINLTGINIININIKIK